MQDTINQLATLTPGTALTLTVPTERTGSNAALSSHLTRLLADARTGLAERLGKREAEDFLDELEAQLKALDPRFLSAGLWAGVVDGAVHLHHLDDSPEPKLVIGDDLDLLALAHQSRHVQAALVVAVSEPGARLLRYRSDAPTLAERMVEIERDAFPLVFGGEEARRGRETGSHQRDERYRQWMRELAAALATLRREDATLAALPVVVVGIGRYLGFLGEVTSEAIYDAAIESSPDALTDAELDERLATTLAELSTSRATLALARIDWATSARRLVVGINEVAAVTAEGRGQLLLIEADADRAALANAILDHLRHGGEVVTVPSGSITGDYQVALITRW